MSKQCFKCGEVKSLSEFYKHKQMKDGHVNKCKTCNLNDVSKHRVKNIDKIRAYDRERGSRQSAEDVRRYRQQNPKKYKAHCMVNNQKRAGNLHEEPCEDCESKNVVAHHDDYDKPLNVRWLCQSCHKKWHTINGEGLNAA
ncbi:MAG: hypothetical protein GY738_29740 [Pseudoalteromonas sp.]|nr:hypothetical protein [Pseudoalteromonas sp.]